MKTIIVDGEQIMLTQLQMELEGHSDIELKGVFTLPGKALEFALRNEVDFAVLETEMPEMNGIQLGKELRRLYPGMVLVYVSDSQDYIVDAMFDAKADYYIMKPYSNQEINDMIQRAVLLAARLKKRVSCRTFGRFDVFIDGVLVNFSSAKAKELLALCVDHEGGNVQMEEAVDKLWENRSYDEKTKNLYRKAVSFCKNLFESYGCKDVFLSARGCCHINKSNVDCDLYRYRSGDKAVEFDGEYMMDYEWARTTEGRLQMSAQQQRINKSK